MRIAVLFGGDSMERDVSVASASQVVAALRARGHEVLAVDAETGVLSAERERAVLARGIDARPPERVARGGLPATLAASGLRDVDVVFLAMHGGGGEDGTMQALLDLARVPYTGTGKLGSALAWDKDVAKRLFRAAGVPTPDWLMAPADAPEVERALGFPVIVKPNGQGSTVGLTLVESPDALAGAIEHAAGFDAEVMIERYVAGRELTVGLLDDVPLAVGEIIPATGPVFDYEAKYQAGRAQEIFPADVPGALAQRVQSLGLTVHRTLKLADYSRVDFRLDAHGELYCLEANTLPGLSSGSLLPQSAAVEGIDFAELCERIVAAALRRHDRR